jgi:hypothetical protein
MINHRKTDALPVKRGISVGMNLLPATMQGSHKDPGIFPPLNNDRK